MTAGESVPNLEAVGQRLRSAGMSPAEADRKIQLLARAASALQKMSSGPSENWEIFFVPGRLECLGKHTDYAGGRSLICPIERGFCLLVSPRRDQIMRISAAATGEDVQFAIEPQLTPEPGHWSNYPMTAAQRVARNFPGQMLGVDLAFASDLPPAAGMSSGSALLIASFLAIAATNQLSKRHEYRQNIDSLETLGSYLGTVENGQSFGTLAGSKGVGTFGGSEDHTAILCGRAGLLSCYSYCPVRLERRVAMPPGYVFALDSSGVVAAKSGDAKDKYNRASGLVSTMMEIWNRQTSRSDPHPAALLASSTDAAAKLRTVLSQADHSHFTAEELINRFEHFLAESEQIVPAATEALAEQDLAEFGRQVDRSQELTETLLGNQVPQTIFLAKSAQQLGAVAASAFGAGFGGAVWAMIGQNRAQEFVNNWKASYQKAYPLEQQRASFFQSSPGPAAMRIKCSCPDREVPLI